MTIIDPKILPGCSFQATVQEGKPKRSLEVLLK